jgi:ribosomal protein S27E
MSAHAAEVVVSAGYALPQWPVVPEPIDLGAKSFLIVAFGHEQRITEVARQWLAQAESAAPTVFVTLESLTDASNVSAFAAALTGARIGVRLMVVGGQFDVLMALAQARAAGALPQEMISFVVHTQDLPMYCAHCRNTFRVAGAPGDEVTCPGCARRLEIHPHFSAVRGSFLASDALARELS